MECPYCGLEMNLIHDDSDNTYLYSCSDGACGSLIEVEDNFNLDGYSIETCIDLIKRTFAIANNSIYFNDRSDYRSALYDVCKTLNPKIDENMIGKEYIHEK